MLKRLFNSLKPAAPFDGTFEVRLISDLKILTKVIENGDGYNITLAGRIFKIGYFVVSGDKFIYTNVPITDELRIITPDYYFGRLFLREKFIRYFQLIRIDQKPEVTWLEMLKVKK